MTEKIKKVPSPEQISPIVKFSQKEIVIGFLALVIGGLFGYGFGGKNISTDSLYSHNKQTEENSSGLHKMSDGSMMQNSGTGNMQGMMHRQVSSEQEFLVHMIPHHQEAVDTAKEVIARGGTTPEIKKLAEDIVVAQEKEIAQMKEWYKNWYGEEFKDNSEYSPMMRDLSKLSGAELDEAFFQDMIKHHTGAIMIAQSFKSYIKHTEIEKLTQDVITTQSKEIMQMRQMLQGL
jgi:uncharacterized protein (DUF305 family)